jgi:DUF4097 and DUF4098 domain-containing protein YvlB
MLNKRLPSFIPLSFLMIFFISLGVQAANISPNDIFSDLFGQEKKEEFHKTLPLKVGGTFSLENVNGSITINTWKEDKVEIKAVKTTKGDSENLKKVEIEIESSPDRVLVDTVYPKIRNLRVSVKYEVKVPEGANIGKVKSVNGSVYMSGPLGNVRASTTNGKVELEGASGDVRLSTTNGSIEASHIRGELEAETTNGSIEVDMESLEDEVKAETVNGGITLRLGSSRKIDADLTAKTVNGTIYLDVPVTFKTIQKSKHSLEGKIGQGGTLVYLKTVNGSIRIK